MLFVKIKHCRNTKHNSYCQKTTVALQVFHNILCVDCNATVSQKREQSAKVCAKWFAYYQTPVYFPYEFTIWQYSSTGKVDGIKGDVDMNVSMKEY